VRVGPDAGRTAGSSLFNYLASSRGLSLVFALAFLVLIALRNQLGLLRQRVPLLLAAALVTGVCFSQVFRGFIESMGLAAVTTALALSAVAAALIVLAWLELYGALGARGAAIGICGSLALSNAVYLILLQLQGHAPAVAAIFILCCPALSVLSLAMAWKKTSIRAVSVIARKTPVRVPAAPLFALSTYGLAAGFMVTMTKAQGSAGSVGGAFSTACMGMTALLILLYTLTKRTFDYRFMYWAILGSLAVGFMLLPVAGYWYADVAVAVGYAVLQITWVTVCADVIHRADLPSVATAGLGAFATYGGIAAGSILASGLLGGMVMNAWQLSVVAVLMVSVLLIVSPALQRDSSWASLWGLIPAPIRSSGELPDELFVVRRCAESAAAHGLTPREGEILILLARGRTTDEIGRTLVISPATVRTHAKRIHEKLGVHSQPELIRRIVFEGQEADSAPSQSDDLSAAI